MEVHRRKTIKREIRRLLKWIDSSIYGLSHPLEFPILRWFYIARLDKWHLFLLPDWERQITLKTISISMPPIRGFHSSYAFEM